MYGRHARHRLASFAHDDGALAVLKVWNECLSHMYPATNIIKYSRRGVIRSALLRKLQVPDWLRDGAKYGEDEVDVECDRIVVRITNLRQRASVLLHGDTNLHLVDSSSLHGELIEEAREIAMALDEWASRLPEMWPRQRLRLPPSTNVPTDDFYAKEVFSYTCSLGAALWNHYYTMRVLTNSTQLQLLKPCSHRSTDEERSRCQREIDVTANDLAASVPFSLRRFRGSDSSPNTVAKYVTLETKQKIEPYFAVPVVWPLSMVAGLADISLDQRDWFRAVLSRIGRLSGDRVLETAPASQWLAD